MSDQYTPGIYTSNLAHLGLGGDKSEPVTLIREDKDSWLFELPESWPFPGWRGDRRWFQKFGATFVPEPIRSTSTEGESNAH